MVGQEALCNKALVMKGEETLHETWVIERGVLFDEAWMVSYKEKAELGKNELSENV